MMKQGFFTALMAMLLLASSACTTSNVVRGPMAVGADLGGLEGVVKKPAQP